MDPSSKTQKDTQTPFTFNWLALNVEVEFSMLSVTNVHPPRAKKGSFCILMKH